MKKPLLAAAALLAVATSAQAADALKMGKPLGLVKLVSIAGDPIVCRNLDDAIEASKIMDLLAESAAGKKSSEIDELNKLVYDLPVGHPVVAHVAWVLRHQQGSKSGTYLQRIPPKRDCRYSNDKTLNILGRTDQTLSTAIKIKTTGLPPGKIAICLTNMIGVFESARDCSDEAIDTGSGFLALNYWAVMNPNMVYRNFDLGEQK